MNTWFVGLVEFVGFVGFVEFVGFIRLVVYSEFSMHAATLRVLLAAHRAALGVWLVCVLQTGKCDLDLIEVGYAVQLLQDSAMWLPFGELRLEASSTLRMSILKGLFGIFQAGETDPHLIIIDFAIELLENLAMWQLICVQKELLSAKVPQDQRNLRMSILKRSVYVLQTGKGDLDLVEVCNAV